MNLWLFPLNMILIAYFHLMRVEPKHFTKELHLQLPEFWSADILRAAICSTPLVALSNGSTLSNNPYMNSIALMTLAGPLALPGLPKPSAADSVSFWNYFAKWFVCKIESGGKNLLLGFAIWLILCIPIMPSSATISSFFDSILRFSEPIQNHFRPPGEFYILSTVFLIYRALLAGVSGQKYYIASLFTGYVAMAVFHNIAINTTFNSSNWKAPVGSGLLASLAWSFLTSYLFAKHDMLTTPKRST